MKLSPSQKRCFAKAREVCAEVEPKLTWLEEVAKAAPQYAEQVQELRDMRDHLLTLCEACTATVPPEAG